MAHEGRVVERSIDRGDLFIYLPIDRSVALSIDRPIGWYPKRARERHAGVLAMSSVVGLRHRIPLRVWHNHRRQGLAVFGGRSGGRSVWFCWRFVRVVVERAARAGVWHDEASPRVVDARRGS